MTTSNDNAERKLARKDLYKLGIRSIAMQSGFSFERMQAPGFTMSMLPTFEKLYGDSKEDVSEFMTYNMEFMNTEMHMGTFLMGLILSMEEKHEDRNLIAGIRNGLFGPLAGIGDAIFWFMLIWGFSAISRIWFAELGYNLGSKFIDKISENTKYVTEAAGILGTMVVGGLIPSYVTFAFSDDLVFGIGGTTVQSVFDGVLPNMLPLAIVFLIYWLFKKKVNVLVIIVGIILLGILMSFLGWM